LAEFGICNFSAPSTAKPPPAAPTLIKTPKAKRKAQEASEPKPKARRDSEPTPEPMSSTASAPSYESQPQAESNKENKEPDMSKNKEDLFSSKIFQEKGGCKPEAADAANAPSNEAKEGGGEQGSSQDPFPKLYNMAKQTFTKDGKASQDASKSTNGFSSKSSTSSADLRPFLCEKCGTGFRIIVDYMLHQHSCKAEELVKEVVDSYGEYLGPKPPNNGYAKNGSKVNQKEQTKENSTTKGNSSTSTSYASASPSQAQDVAQNNKCGSSTAKFNDSENTVDSKEKKTQITKNSKLAHHCDVGNGHVEKISSMASMKGNASTGEGEEKIKRNDQYHPNAPSTRVTFKDDQTRSQDINNELATDTKMNCSLNREDVKNGDVSYVTKVSKLDNEAKHCTNAKQVTGKAAISPDTEVNGSMTKNHATTSSILSTSNCLEDEDIVMQENIDLHNNTIQRNKIQMESLRESLPSAHTSSGSWHSSQYYIPIMMTAMLLVTSLALRVTLDILSLY
jgi:hypothetical protein